MLGIHRNSDWKEFLKSCESFLRKSQFSTLTYLNPGFGGPWDISGIFFVNVIFITLQKKSFGQKFFWIPCAGSKVQFCQNWKIAKMALFSPCMKFKTFFGQKTFFEALWRWHLQKIFNFKMTFTNMIERKDQDILHYTQKYASRLHCGSTTQWCIFIRPCPVTILFVGVTIITWKKYKNPIPI